MNEHLAGQAANETYKLPPKLFDARCKACWFVAAVLLLVVASFWSLDLQWAQFLSLEAARSRFSKKRVGARAQPRSAACSRLAGSASARPQAAAKAVPRADMASVSAVPTATLRRNAGLKSGGKNSPRNRAMLAAASCEKNCAHCRSSDQKLATTRSNNPALNQQALQRASHKGGGSL